MHDDEIYEIAAVLDQWSEPSVVYFKVQSNEGKVYLLRYDEPEDEWTLQSGFDGDELRNSIDACSFYEARPAGLTLASVLKSERRLADFWLGY